MLKGWCFFFSSRRRHTRCSRDWSSDVCSSDLMIREIETSHNDAERVIERFGDPDRLLSVSVSLVEDAAFGESARQLGMRPDGGRRQEAESLTGPVVVERLHQFAGEMFGPAIVGREVGGGGKVELSCDLEWNIAETLGDGLDRLRRRAHRCDVTARVHVMAAHVGRHPSESSRIVKRSGQRFGFPEIPQDSRELAQREERLTKVETKVDRALDLLARVGQW